MVSQNNQAENYLDQNPAAVNKWYLKARREIASFRLNVVRVTRTQNSVTCLGTIVTLLCRMSRSIPVLSRSHVVEQ